MMMERIVGLTRRHAELLEARGLDIEMMERLGVGVSDRLGVDTISIPYFRGDEVCGTKYRTISGEKKFSQDAGSAQILYNINCLYDDTLEGQPVTITEGELDCWSALQSGFARCVSVPAGAPAVEVGERATAKYRFVDDLLALPPETVFVLAVDGDEPGSALRKDLAVRLGERRCKWVRYPKGCKDLNDALQAYGPKGVVETLHRAQWIIGNVYAMSEIPPLAPSVPHDSGFPGLSQHYRLRLSDFTVVSGVPSSGKSSFVIDLACRMAAHHGWPSCFASFEMIPQLDMKRTMRTWFGGGFAKDLDEETTANADRFIERYFRFVVPDDDSYATLDWVMARFAASAIRYGTRLFILDPFNEIEHDRPIGMALTEYVGKAIREFKAFARRYEAHFILVAHPAKMKRDGEGKYPIPTLYDISDSAHFANKADVGIIVHRKSEDETLIRVAKSRYHTEIGKPGDVVVRYHPQRASFELVQ